MQKIAYEKHPVSAERKAELRGEGFKILDVRFKPDDLAELVKGHEFEPGDEDDREPEPEPDATDEQDSEPEKRPYVRKADK